MLIILVIGMLLIDNFLSVYYSDFDFNNQFDLIVFPIIVSVFMICQVFVVKHYIFREQVLTTSKKSDFITRLSMASTIIILTIVLVIVLQIVLFGFYYTNLIQIGVAFSYMVSIIAFGFLIYILLKWYKEDKEFIILIYAVAIISIVFRVISILLMESSLLANSDFMRNFESIAFFADLEPNTIAFSSWEWYSICSIVSIMLLWLTNAVFLRNYYKRFSRLKYFILVILLPSFTMIDFVINQSFVESLEVEPLLFDIIVVLSGVLGGILLAIPYFIIARSIKDPNNNIRHHLIFVGFGLIIFVISGSAIIDHLPFPPFGFTSILAMQLAAIIIYVSLYKSAVSFSLDSVLRKSINKEMNGMADMLKKIGNSEMNRKMLDNTIEAQQKVHDNMTETQHISPTMDNDKIKEYIELISEEIQQSKK
jgi:hypothetical protein